MESFFETSKNILKALSKYSELEDHIQAINEKKGNSRCLVPRASLSTVRG